VNNTPEFMEKVMQINLMGPIALTQALLPSMIQAGRIHPPARFA
jgi:NAD(P)-dependent dehydrogenase (short-subunit alcohol dehydrogenase family)